MKMKKLIALSTLAVGFGALVSFAPAKRIQVRAESEETTVVEEIEQKQSKFLDEILVPLVIALTSGNGATLIGMAVIGYVKNKKEKARNNKLTALVSMLFDYIKKLDEAQKKVEEMIKIFENSYGNTLNLIEDEKKVLLSYQEDLAKIQDLKNTMVCMAEAQLASLKSQAESVKSGLSHEISEIEEKLALLK